MARQYLIPGSIYINESGSNDYRIPGVIYVNESVAGGAGLTVIVSDTLTFSDAIIGGWGFTQTDSVSLLETLNGKYELNVLSDTIDLSDGINGFLGRTFGEQINFSDIINPLVAYLINFPDSESLSDSVSISVKSAVAVKVPYHQLYAGLNDLV